MRDEDEALDYAGYYAAQLVEALENADAPQSVIDRAKTMQEHEFFKECSDVQQEFRVGCWNGKFKDDTVALRHDSMGEQAEVDLQEIHDLDDLVSLLILRSKVEHGNGEDLERLRNLIYNLEA